MRVLVTGGAGFIGSYLTDAYLDRGDRVTVVDDLTRGHRENVNPEAHFIQLDIRDHAQLLALFKRERFDLISHHAAQIDVRRSVTDPTYDASVNVLGTLNLLQAAIQIGAQGLIFASSGGVLYGEVVEPAPETALKEPLSPYGVSKLTAEHYLHVFRALHGLRCVALRYGNVYGPRQNPHGEAGVVAIFTERLRAGQPATIYGDGQQIRDYIHVADVVRANLLAGEKLDMLKVARVHSIDELAFNVGTGIGTSVNRLYKLLCQQLDVKTPAIHVTPRPGELQCNVLDGRKAEERLGFRPRYDIQAGLSATIQAL